MVEQDPEIAARLARIERRLDEIGASLGAPQIAPAPASAERRDTARALQRLGVAIWIAGLIALGAGSWIAGLEASRSPRANVCASADAASYDECLVQPSAPESESLLEALRRKIAGAEVVKDRVVRRSETQLYSTSVRRLAGIAVGWTVVAFGSFAVLAWVARGLRPRRSSRTAPSSTGPSSL